MYTTEYVPTGQGCSRRNTNLKDEPETGMYVEECMMANGTETSATDAYAVGCSPTVDLHWMCR